MDNKLLQKTRDKLKHDLSGEEQEALRRCSATINTHTRIGAMLGGSLSVYGMYRRKLWPLSKYWGRGLFFGIGGIVVGMQIGLVTASIQCVSIVKALPNPDHVMKALREVQVELQDARRRPLQEAREWSQRSEDDHDEAVPTEQGQSNSAWDIAPNSGGGGGGNQVYNGPGPAPSQTTQDMETQKTPSQQQQPNIWQQLRGENANKPETAWDRLRTTGSSTSKGNSQTAGATSPPPPSTYSPFDASQNDDAGSVNDTESSSSSSSFPSTASGSEKERQQNEFDRLLEQERKGEAEDATRRRTKYGDYS